MRGVNLKPHSFHNGQVGSSQADVQVVVRQPESEACAGEGERGEGVGRQASQSGFSQWAGELVCCNVSPKM